ncbi:MAG: hypothetical protein HYU98_01500 [Deltaproteobacteria bacterium]|nr:hypothetical protein [Deltaproteobacteria bacterium]
MPLEKTLADEVVVLAPALLVGLAAKAYIIKTSAGLASAAAEETAAVFVPLAEKVSAAVAGAATAIDATFEAGYKEAILEGIWGL